MWHIAGVLQSQGCSPSLSTAIRGSTLGPAVQGPGLAATEGHCWLPWEQEGVGKWAVGAGG